MIPRFLGAPKSCVFGVILKMCAINSTLWVELNWWGHVWGSRAGVINKISDGVWIKTLQESNVGVSCSKTKSQQILSGIALFFIFLHQPPEPPKSSEPPRLAPGRFQTSSPWSRPWPTPTSRGVLVLMLVFVQLFGQLVAIQSLLDELLALLQSDRSWLSCLTLVSRSRLVNP